MDPSGPLATLRRLLLSDVSIVSLKRKVREKKRTERKAYTKSKALSVFRKPMQNNNKHSSTDPASAERRRRSGAFSKYERKSSFIALNGRIQLTRTSTATTKVTFLEKKLPLSPLMFLLLLKRSRKMAAKSDDTRPTFNRIITSNSPPNSP